MPPREPPGGLIFYKLMGKLPVPCRDAVDWGMWFKTAQRHVAETQVGPLWVSTVFLGLDHGFGGDPLLFETMIFNGDAGEDVYQERYSTWAQAEDGHARAVAAAELMVSEADVFLGGARDDK